MHLEDTHYRPTHERTSSQRLKDVMKLLGPRPIERQNMKTYIEFRVLDSLGSKFIATERYHDEHADKVPEGIKGFSDYFHSGVILPDGELLLNASVAEWRMAIFEYHGGWYITVLHGMGIRPTDFPVGPELWGSTLAGIGDDRIRSEAMGQSMKCAPSAHATYVDVLKFVHEIHRHKVYRSMSLGEKSVVEFHI
jgi:hypothetical protein